MKLQKLTRALQSSKINILHHLLRQTELVPEFFKERRNRSSRNYQKSNCLQMMQTIALQQKLDAGIIHISIVSLHSISKHALYFT